MPPAEKMLKRVEYIRPVNVPLSSVNTVHAESALSEIHEHLNDDQKSFARPPKSFAIVTDSDNYFQKLDQEYNRTVSVINDIRNQVATSEKLGISEIVGAVSPLARRAITQTFGFAILVLAASPGPISITTSLGVTLAAHGLVYANMDSAHTTTIAKTRSDCVLHWFQSVRDYIGNGRTMEKLDELSKQRVCTTRYSEMFLLRSLFLSKHLSGELNIFTLQRKIRDAILSIEGDLGKGIREKAEKARFIDFVHTMTLHFTFDEHKQSPTEIAKLFKQVSLNDDRLSELSEAIPVLSTLLSYDKLLDHAEMTLRRDQFKQLALIMEDLDKWLETTLHSFVYTNVAGLCKKLIDFVYYVESYTRHDNFPEFAYFWATRGLLFAAILIAVKYILMAAFTAYSKEHDSAFKREIKKMCDDSLAKQNTYREYIDSHCDGEISVDFLDTVDNFYQERTTSDILGSIIEKNTGAEDRTGVSMNCIHVMLQVLRKCISESRQTLGFGSANIRAAQPLKKQPSFACQNKVESARRIISDREGEKKLNEECSRALEHLKKWIEHVKETTVKSNLEKSETKGLFADQLATATNFVQIIILQERYHRYLKNSVYSPLRDELDQLTKELEELPRTRSSMASELSKIIKKGREKREIHRPKPRNVPIYNIASPPPSPRENVPSSTHASS